MPDLSNLGLRLRYARKELRKLTQPKLALAAGVKQPSVSELETGETKDISGPTLIALSKALRVRPEWLALGELPIEPTPESSLKPDERDLLQNYRSASNRWKISLRYMAGLRADNEQEEVASGMNVLLAKILGSKPYPVEKMGPGWKAPTGPGPGEHRFEGADGEPRHTSGASKKRDRNS